MSDRLDLAIWLESQELSKGGQHDNESSQTCEQSGIQVHLNFWKLPDYNALDIGIEFPVLINGKVNIFINTQNKIEAKDITEILKIDTVINTVFNEFISTTSCPVLTSCRKAERTLENSLNRSSEKSLDKSSKAFCLCCLSDPIHICKKNSGTLVTFSISNHRCDRRCGCSRQYIRLRLYGDGIDKIYIKDKIPASKFEYYTSKREFIDFRLNNARSLPQSLLEDGVSYPTLNKVRCFLMVESAEDLSLYSKNYKKVRAIEKENWSLYIKAVIPYIQDKDEEDFFDRFTAKGRKKHRAILAYQWNADDPAIDFSLFAEIKRSEVSWRTFFFFLIMTTGFGLPPSILAPYVETWVKALWGYLCR